MDAMTTAYAVVQPDSPSYGILISRHRSREAAEAAIARATRALRRQAGMQQSWLDWRIVALTGAARGRINRQTRRINLRTGDIY